MQIQLTDVEIAFLAEAAGHPSQLRADVDRPDGGVIELLLAMQLLVRRGDNLEITILGMHLLKLARTLPNDD